MELIPPLLGRAVAGQGALVGRTLADRRTDERARRNGNENVHGRDDTAACLRRGVVAIGGDVGMNAGRAAIAGTLVIAGSAGTTTGRWCKRASIVALGPITVSPTFRYACTFRPPAVGVLLTSLKRHGLPVTANQTGGLYRRYSGDLAESDKGEILHWTGA